MTTLDKPSGVTPDGEWVPAFPGQRPPFRKGHTTRMTHGAFVGRYTGPVAQEILTRILAYPQCGYLAEPRYELTILDLADTEAQMMLIRAWRDRQSSEDAATDVLYTSEESEGGGPRPAVVKGVVRHTDSAQNVLGRLQAHAARLRRDCGLTPKAAASMGRDIAGASKDLAAIWAEVDDRERAARAGS